MDSFHYRSSSRILAIVDSVLSCIGLLIMVVAAIYVTVAASGDENSNLRSKIDPNAMIVLMWILWIAVVFSSFFVAIELWAATRFLKATKQGTDYVEAAKRARIWRNLNIAFLILTFLNLFDAASLVAILVALIFRGIILFCVCNFIEELDKAIATPPGFGNMESVVVNL